MFNAAEIFSGLAAMFVQQRCCNPSDLREDLRSFVANDEFWALLEGDAGDFIRAAAEHCVDDLLTDEALRADRRKGEAS